MQKVGRNMLPQIPLGLHKSFSSLTDMVTKEGEELDEFQFPTATVPEGCVCDESEEMTQLSIVHQIHANNRHIWERIGYHPSTDIEPLVRAASLRQLVDSRPTDGLKMREVAHTLSSLADFRNAQAPPAAQLFGKLGDVVDRTRFPLAWQYLVTGEKTDLINQRNQLKNVSKLCAEMYLIDEVGYLKGVIAEFDREIRTKRTQPRQGRRF